MFCIHWRFSMRICQHLLWWNTFGPFCCTVSATITVVDVMRRNTGHYARCDENIRRNQIIKGSRQLFGRSLLQQHKIFLSARSIKKWNVQAVGKWSVHCHCNSTFVLVDVNITKASGDTLVTTTYGVEVHWNNVENVRVTVLGRYLNKTVGLCGTFDKVPDNDYLTSFNTTVSKSNVTFFGNSWKTDPSCPDATDVDHPCDTYPHKRSMAVQNCSALLRDPFWSCSQAVNATTQGFIDNCEYDMCACNNNDPSCLCESLKAYVAECQSHQISITWKNLPEFEMCSKYFSHQGKLSCLHVIKPSH